MKRWVHAVSEPSSKEYGEAVSEARRRVNDRYEPFELTKTYFNRSSAGSTGYRVTLPEEGIEYIADDNGRDSWSNDFEYKLYGPFLPYEIESWSELFSNKPVGTFKNIDQVMNWMFENVEYDED